MIFEQMNTQHLSNELRYRFFELMTDELNRSFHSFISDVAIQIKETLNAEYIGVYLFDKLNETYYLTSNIDTTFSSKQIITPQEFHLLREDNITGHVFHGSSLIENSSSFSYGVPLNAKDTNAGFLLLTFKQELDLNRDGLLCLQSVASDTLRIIERSQTYFNTLDEEKKYELLFRVTAKFHSSMDMEDVLGEIIKTLEEVYPKFQYYLLLSHDYSSKSNLPIKELIYDSDVTSKASAQAYLTGNIQFEDRVNGQYSCLYAPLKGRQGVYGVLQVITPETMIFPDEDVEFIGLLANTGGNALENARLYQQSRRLISDLQLINKTSHKLNSSLRLSETISYMASQITSSFKADEVGFILYNDSGDDYKVLPGSTDFFTRKEANSFIHYLDECVTKQEDALFIGDFSMKHPELDSLYQSVIAIPMGQRGNFKGFVVVLHKKTYFFSFETFKLLQSLVHHSSLAFANSMLREELERLVITDYLTKLYSRKYLDEKLHNHMDTDDQGVFLLIDIDNFKKVNDTYGHQAGDEIIIQVANILKDEIAESDIAARWGGEELAIYLPNISLVEGIDTALRVVKQVEKSTNPRVTISCGVSYWNDKENDQVKDVFIRADQALYDAKKAGKNCVMVEKNHKPFYQ